VIAKRSKRSARTRRTPGAESSRKVLSLIAYFEASRPLASIETLSRAINVPKSTAYRYVSLLREFGFLVEVPGGQYSLGPRAMGMARAAQAAVSYLEVARPAMEQLSHTAGETVFLLRRVGDHAVCLGRCDPVHPVRIFLEIGTAVPLHVGASPKLLLASLSERERESYLTRIVGQDRELKTRLAALREDLVQIRTKGYAITVDEITPGVWACAAPIVETGQVIAVMSVAGPAFRLDRGRRTQNQAMVKRAAAEVSASLQRLQEIPRIPA
jgi:DNA-binding IclR family transcriptional regulator